MQQPQPNNNFIPQPSFNMDFMQQPMPNPEDITDLTTTNMALILMAKAFKLNYSTPTNNNQRISSNPRNRQIAQPGCSECSSKSRNGNVIASRAKGNANRNNGNQIRCYNYRGLGRLARNCTIRPRRRDDAYLQTQLLIAQKEEAGIQLQAEDLIWWLLQEIWMRLRKLMQTAFRWLTCSKHQHRVLRQTKLPSMTQMDQSRYNLVEIVMIMRYLICLLKRSSILIYSSPFQNHTKFNRMIVMLSLQYLVWNKVGGTIEQHPATAKETRALYD
ncbi:hypothetical protein Tco_1578377 [Tanacetum coccineum]